MMVMVLKMVMMMVIAMTTNKDYWKLRFHHIRKRMGKWAVVHKVVMNDGDGDHDRHDDDGIAIK